MDLSSPLSSSFLYCSPPTSTVRFVPGPIWLKIIIKIIDRLDRKVLTEQAAALSALNTKSRGWSEGASVALSAGVFEAEDLRMNLSSS